MPEILHSIRLEPNLEYKVERYGKTYFAGAKNAHFHQTGHIHASLYIDRIDGKEVIDVRKPKKLNPFYKETITRDKRVPEFCVEDVLIEGYSFRDIVNNLNTKLLYQYSKRIGFDDAEAFFSRLYNHYKRVIEGTPKEQR